MNPSGLGLDQLVQALSRLMAKPSASRLDPNSVVRPGEFQAHPDPNSVVRPGEFQAHPDPNSVVRPGEFTLNNGADSAATLAATPTAQERPPMPNELMMILNALAAMPHKKLDPNSVVRPGEYPLR